MIGRSYSGVAGEDVAPSGVRCPDITPKGTISCGVVAVGWEIALRHFFLFFSAWRAVACPWGTFLAVTLLRVSFAD